MVCFFFLSFVAEAVYRGHTPVMRKREGPARERGLSMQRREEWKEGKERAHDSQENSLSQIYFDDSWSHKARRVYLCSQARMIPIMRCFKSIIYS